MSNTKVFEPQMRAPLGTASQVLTHEPETRNPTSQTLNPNPPMQTLNPKPQTLDPQPQAPNSNRSTPNPPQYAVNDRYWITHLKPSPLNQRGSASGQTGRRLRISGRMPGACMPGACVLHASVPTFPCHVQPL